jgi:hypothetical protein
MPFATIEHRRLPSWAVKPNSKNSIQDPYLSVSEVVELGLGVRMRQDPPFVHNAVGGVLFPLQKLLQHPGVGRVQVDRLHVLCEASLVTRQGEQLGPTDAVIRDALQEEPGIRENEGSFTWQ